MMAERGLSISHTTILRWVIQYVPEFEERWNRWARRVNSSWRVDETYIRVRGKWEYLNRAVDKYGKTVNFLLRPDRGVAAAQAFFPKALKGSLPPWPRKVTVDGHRASHHALRLLRREDPKWKYVLVRSYPVPISTAPHSGDEHGRLYGSREYGRINRLHLIELQQVF
jgi:transposase-like protein